MGDGVEPDHAVEVLKVELVEVREHAENGPGIGDHEADVEVARRPREPVDEALLCEVEADDSVRDAELTGDCLSDTLKGVQPARDKDQVEAAGRELQCEFLADTRCCSGHNGPGAEPLFVYTYQVGAHDCLHS